MQQLVILWHVIWDMNNQKIIFIVGPTAVGKSDVALALAKKIKGEVLSCDSIQVYKEIFILSNKPSQRERREVPHCLLDLVSIQEEFDVVAFREKALKAIEDVHSRGKIPIIVGGSGMYMGILLDGIFEGAGKDEDLRKSLTEEAHRYGTEHLHQQLVQKDEEAARKIHPNDLKRIINND